MADNWLVYSLAEFRELIFACFRVAGVHSVVEVGAEHGTFTRELVAWAGENDGHVYCVEPQPGPEVLALSERSDRVSLLRGRSPQALLELPATDAYLLDGDHNYYTVVNELRTIAEKAREASQPFLVILQDIGWPCGRRDFYYAPDALPEAAVHPYSFEKGVTLDSSKLIEGGFRSQGQFAWALHEGGPANGVLTALEDFLEEHPELVFANVPCIFGLAVVYPKDASFSEALSDLLRPLDNNELLQRLEENRLRLYLRLLELQDERAAEQGELHRVRQEVDAARAQLGETMGQLAGREGELRDLRAHLANIESHPVYRALMLVRRGLRLLMAPLRSLRRMP
ncbi:MAG TPA: class I SAM-dependent methyltransferase [Dehalococcoidia bacterium]|nr:class I SAM-dependent methyltransferase [Dehalococcoidia bacterium]